MMKKLRLGLACASLLACGGKTDAPPSAESASPTTTAAAGTPPGASAPAPAATRSTPAATSSTLVGKPAGKCSFTVTGDFAMTVEAVATKSPPNGKAMATADYWQTDEQLRAALEMITGLDKRKSKDAVKAEVDATMKKDPKFVLLLLNCGTDQGMLTFGPNKGAKYADLPFKPATYPISKGAGAPNEVSVMITLHPAGGHPALEVSEPGTFAITKYDLAGIAGTFAFKAASTKGEKIEIKGSFDYPCVGAACKI